MSRTRATTMISTEGRGSPRWPSWCTTTQASGGGLLRERSGAPVELQQPLGYQDPVSERRAAAPRVRVSVSAGHGLRVSFALRGQGQAWAQLRPS